VTTHFAGRSAPEADASTRSLDLELTKNREEKEDIEQRREKENPNKIKMDRSQTLHRPSQEGQ
jgi:hypothetical protein